MDADHRTYLEKRHDVRTWHGRSKHARRSVEELVLTGSELRDWSLVRAEHEPGAVPKLHAMWRHGEGDERLLSVDVFTCASVKAAHDYLLEALGNMQSDAIERSKDGPGDVAFRLNGTMVLFARGNVVVLVRNAGREVVDVHPAARELDEQVVARLEGRR